MPSVWQGIWFTSHGDWTLAVPSTAMSAPDVGWPITQTLSSCDSSCGRPRSDCRSDLMHESSIPCLTPQCWPVSEDSFAKYSIDRPSHLDEHGELLAGDSQHHCFQLVRHSCCLALGRCGIWFEWACFQAIHTSTLRYCNLTLFDYVNAT